MLARSKTAGEECFCYRKYYKLVGDVDVKICLFSRIVTTWRISRKIIWNHCDNSKWRFQFGFEKGKLMNETMKYRFWLQFKVNPMISTTRNGSNNDMNFGDDRLNKLHSIFRLLQTGVICYTIVIIRIFVYVK